MGEGLVTLQFVFFCIWLRLSVIKKVKEKNHASLRLLLSPSSRKVFVMSSPGLVLSCPCLRMGSYTLCISVESLRFHVEGYPCQEARDDPQESYPMVTCLLVWTVSSLRVGIHFLVPVTGAGTE